MIPCKWTKTKLDCKCKRRCLYIIGFFSRETWKPFFASHLPLPSLSFSLSLCLHLSFWLSLAVLLCRSLAAVSICPSLSPSLPPSLPLSFSPPVSLFSLLSAMSKSALPLLREICCCAHEFHAIRYIFICLLFSFPCLSPSNSLSLSYALTLCPLFSLLPYLPFFLCSLLLSLPLFLCSPSLSLSLSLSVSLLSLCPSLSLSVSVSLSFCSAHPEVVAVAVSAAAVP